MWRPCHVSRPFFFTARRRRAIPAALTCRSPSLVPCAASHAKRHSTAHARPLARLDCPCCSYPQCQKVRSCHHRRRRAPEGTRPTPSPKKTTYENINSFPFLSRGSPCNHPLVDNARCTKLRSTYSQLITIVVKPFPSSADMSLTYLLATTTKICANRSLHAPSQMHFVARIASPYLSQRPRAAAVTDEYKIFPARLSAIHFRGGQIR